MKKSFQFFAGLLIILILSSISSNSQGFDYLKKTRETLNRDKSKIPSVQQLEKLSIKLSNYYYSNNLGKINEDDFQSSNTSFRTLNLSQSDLMKKSSEFGIGNVQFSQNGLPVFVSLPEVGNKKHTLKFLTKENILDYIKENKSLFKIENPDKEFKLNSASTDNEGNNHFKMQQYIDDVPFWGREIILHFNKNNELYMVNGRYSETLKNHSIIEKINSNEAVGIAENHIRKVIENVVLDNKTKKLLNYDGPKAEKYYWQKDDKSGVRLVWMVEIRPNIIDNYRYFIDAKTGEILEKYNSSPADGAEIGRASCRERV